MVVDFKVLMNILYPVNASSSARDHIRLFPMDGSVQFSSSLAMCL
jgi:hypothetical protein